MKAAVLHNLHQPFEWQDVPEPVISPGEALIQIKAAALNHRDVWIQKGQYAGIRLPIIVGSDGAGLVTQVADPADEHWLGREVLINPGHDWGDNPAAQGKDFKILGLPDNGTFAEYVKVPAKYLHAKPAHLTFAEAAALPLGGLTAFRALFSRAQLQAGETVLITGIGGGVALFALQFAIAKGATVYVTSGSGQKLERAMALGAAGGANYTEADWADQLKKRAGGFQVIIDSAAGEGFSQLVDLATPGGRIAMYGQTRGKIKDLNAGRIFWKQLSVFGSTMGSEQEFAGMLKLVEQTQLRPVIDQVFPLAETETAIRRMDNREQFGKIVLAVPG